MSVEIVVSDVRRVTAEPMRSGQWSLQIDTIDGTFAVVMTEAQAKAMAAAFDEPEAVSVDRVWLSRGHDVVSAK